MARSSRIGYVGHGYCWNPVPSFVEIACWSDEFKESARQLEYSQRRRFLKKSLIE